MIKNKFIFVVVSGYLYNWKEKEAGELLGKLQKQLKNNVDLIEFSDFVWDLKKTTKLNINYWEVAFKNLDWQLKMLLNDFENDEKESENKIYLNFLKENKIKILTTSNYENVFLADFKIEKNCNSDWGEKMLADYLNDEEKEFTISTLINI